MAQPVQAQSSPISSDLTSCIAVCEIFRAIPSERIEQALRTIDRSKHRMGKFPDHLVVYFVIFMGLFMEHSYLQIFELLQNTLSWLSGFGSELHDLSDTAVSKARRRIGFEPMRELFELTSAPVLEPGAPGTFLGEYRLCLLDGTVIDVADTPENQILGKRKNQNGEGAYPQLRLVALMDYATRVVVDLEIASMVGNGEVPLAEALAARLASKLLIVADRNFPGTDLCRAIVGKGSDFLFRVKSSLKLKPIKQFADGSYTAFVSEARAEPLLVRVFEYTLEGSSERYKMITSLMDAERISALDLAGLYPHRWAAETIFGDIKSVLKTRKVLLRSKSPATVAQEIYGLFLAYNVVRAFMHEAAKQGGVPPSHLSFRHSLNILKFNLPKVGDFSP
jgi:hypothetical protein